MCVCVCGQAEMERQLSAFTGGTAEITDVQPYTPEDDPTSGQQQRSVGELQLRLITPTIPGCARIGRLWV